MNVAEVVHFFNIKVKNEKRETVEFLIWDNLKWELRLKYDWYFKYRAALLQVKYPKFDVYCLWGNEPAKGKTLEEIKRQKIVSKKAKITKFSNQLKNAVDNWNSLFPIEDDIDYKKAVLKIDALKSELFLFEKK